MSTPIVFLPGYLCDPQMYLAQVLHLSHSHTVINAPLLGERCEEMASALLPSLPPRFALVGACLGGIVALEIMRRAPERVTRACLISTDALVEAPQAIAAREPVIVHARAGHIDDALTVSLPEEVLAPGPYRSEVLDYYRRMARSFGPQGMIAQTRAFQRRRDHQATLRMVHCPVRVIGGAHDTLVTPKRQAFMAEMLSHGSYSQIEGAGHLPTLEAAHEVSDILRDWMSRKPLAA
ncbi:alpha/beta fold hydrolase [Pseudooceanicola sp. C21-150M6]|uniref:alpha/beta fold hydrolase n=1 Tax=Pseudooceanicola sp. C21-150M6 TaxID=3434355 RepID=UPI003D7F5822